jgi:hypothetical protein
MDKTPIALKDLADHLFDALSLKIHASPVYNFRNGDLWFQVEKILHKNSTEYSVTVGKWFLLRTVRSYRDAITTVNVGDKPSSWYIPLINIILDHAGSNYVVIDEGDPRRNIVITPDMIKG